MGTPAEETIGGKIIMIEQGYFKGVDLAVMSHPSTENKISGESLAYHAVEVHFKGKAAHAAADPDKGINALNALMITFMGINAMREHFTDDVRIHGIIAHGGDAPNIVPEFTSGKFYLRAAKKSTADALKSKFLDIVKGAELITGAAAEIVDFERSFDDMNTNKVLNDICKAAMSEFGMTDISDDTTFKASLDMGNVSYVVPAIHPYFDICNGRNIALHTTEFANMTITDYAHEQMRKMACALAMTGLKVSSDSKIYQTAAEEFKESSIGAVF